MKLSQMEKITMIKESNSKSFFTLMKKEILARIENDAIKNNNNENEDNRYVLYTMLSIYEKEKPSIISLRTFRKSTAKES